MKNFTVQKNIKSRAINDHIAADYQNAPLTYNISVTTVKLARSTTSTNGKNRVHSLLTEHNRDRRYCRQMFPFIFVTSLKVNEIYLTLIGPGM